MNTELQKLYDWLTASKLTLNIKKSNFVIFHSYKKRLDYQQKICIFDSEQNKYVNLEHETNIKYLGILIDKNLTWKHHIDAISTKISKGIGLIAKIHHFVRRNILINVYQSLIHPYLTYGIAVWGQACKTYLDKILVLQKRVMRMMYFSDRYDHAIPLFLDLRILPVTFLYCETVFGLMYDINNDNAPLNILNLFDKSSSIHSHNTYQVH